MKTNRFSWKARLRSFAYAFRGIGILLKGEHNAWLHLAATIGVFLAGYILQVSRLEWVALVFCITLVWMAEMANTCIEKIMDHITPEQHPRVKDIKDMAAGMVLIAAIAALVTGCFIFIPKLFS